MARSLVCRLPPVAALVVVLASIAIPRPASALKFRFPVADPALIWADMILHVDHDPAALGQGNIFCLASNCTEDFPNCYDQHRGTDFILDGGFGTMDQGIAQVVAAADGTVIEAVDGNYDRCHADVKTQEVTCDGNPIQANYVALRHGDGTVTLYYHLKKGSVAVQVGQVVACGDTLGLVGSSGISSMPHVHFQVEDPAGAILDPYPGACGTDEAWWVVEDAGNGLPGPWCEGQPIPPEPVPEPVPEAVPEPTPEPEPEPVPEPPADDAPDASIADDGSDPGIARPDDGVAFDVPSPTDPGAADATGRLDVGGIVSSNGPFGCAAGTGSPGIDAVALVLPFLLLPVFATVRRRRIG